MLGQAKSVMLQGAEGLIISVECDVSQGMPGFQMVGYLSAENVFNRITEYYKK